MVMPEIHRNRDNVLGRQPTQADIQHIILCTPYKASLNSWKTSNDHKDKYNYFVDTEGNIYEGLGEHISGTHTGHANKSTIGIAIERVHGQKKYDITNEQTEALADLIAYFAEKYDFDPNWYAHHHQYGKDKPHVQWQQYYLYPYGTGNIEQFHAPIQEIRELARSRTPTYANKPPSTLTPNQPPIVPRTMWGCPDGQVSICYSCKEDGSLKVEDPQPTRSPIRPTHIIVHHTSDNKNSDDPVTPINFLNREYENYKCNREIGKFCDISYGFVIDSQGTIYEGRARSAYDHGNLISGHAGKAYSNVSLGIALVGNFHDKKPSDRAMQSLIDLIAWKVGLLGIDDPTGNAMTEGGKLLPIICGHREVDPTNICPGDEILRRLPWVREEVKKANP